MHSSISDSKSAALTYGKALLGICALILITLEVLSSYLIKHRSVIYARVSRQYSEAFKVRPSNPMEPASVLMVGNSLLLEGVDVNRLRELTSSSMRVYPVFLEATGYYDWFYALRRLFRHGARPQVVVVGVGVNYFLGNTLRQDFTPMMFLDTQDVLSVASALHLNRTATSNLLLEHWSVFWDTRSDFRTRILVDVIPRVQDLFLLANPRPAVPLGPQVEAMTISRLRSLRELCEGYRASLILLIPPTLSSEAAVQHMAVAAKKAGVEISVPIDPAALSAKFYQPDGMHLNPEGATLFTSALATDLPKRVGVPEIVVSRYLRSDP